MKFCFRKDERLIIELVSGEILEAEYLDGNENRLDVRNIKDYTTGEEIPGMLCYYRNEILSIKTLKISEETNDEHESENINEYILLNRCEFERLKIMVRTSIYFGTMDKRYNEALNHLSSCETIGVAALSQKLGRAAGISLLVMASWDQVYIFDIEMFDKKELSDDLKFILESNAIRKVVHDARSIIDCLHHVYNIKIGRLFDTKVADLMITTKETGTTPKKARNLSECLAHYLNFPSSILDNVLKTPLAVWGERPFKSTQKKNATLLAVYLITLMHTMEDIMLKDFYKAMQDEFNSITKATAIEAQMMLCNDRISDKTINLVK